MLTARVGPEPSSTRPGAGDDPRPRCLGLRPRPPRQLSRCLTGEYGPPASTVCAATIRPSPSDSLPRPHLLALALAVPSTYSSDRLTPHAGGIRDGVHPRVALPPPGP